MTTKPRIALAIGDPNGVGPEICLKTCATTDAADLTVVGERAVLASYADRLGLPMPETIHEPGTTTEVQAGVIADDAGRATVAAAEAAIRLAEAGAVDAVVAAPHNETAVNRAGIAFDGYPGLLARATGTDPDAVFLMLVGPGHRIVNVTLHVSVREALDLLTTERIVTAARAADAACRRFGIEAPRIGVCGINPHASEGGLFGPEDQAVVVPAVERARASGLAIDGPVGADVLLAEGGHDAYLAMFHDQAHIPIKLAGRGNSYGLSIGAPVLFATVAHGSAHDIAGQGRADPAALAGVVRQMAATLRSAAGG
ncbi:MAG: 4-hydroxythreonine-4-phosphate dehydrogenase PdxA [Alphaproteobacteria bacterium]